MPPILPESLLWSAVFVAGLAASLLIVAVGIFWQRVPAEDRSYYDQLPPLLRLLWPPVRAISFSITARFPPAWLERTHRRLALASALFLMAPEDYIGLQVVSGLIMALLAAFSAITLSLSVWLPAVLGFAFGALLPMLWLRERRLRRNREILRMLPIYLDYLTLAVEAGLNFTSALSQAIANGPAGMLRQELNLVQRDIKAGLTRSKALRRLHERVAVPEIGAMVAAVNQAEQTGGSLGKILRTQAERSRTERFQRAEKAAMEAPVKLLGPLIMFIFPVSFLIIAFPIVMMMLHS